MVGDYITIPFYLYMGVYFGVRTIYDKSCYILKSKHSLLVYVLYDGFTCCFMVSQEQSSPYKLQMKFQSILETNIVFKGSGRNKHLYWEPLSNVVEGINFPTNELQ